VLNKSNVGMGHSDTKNGRSCRHTVQTENGSEKVFVFDSGSPLDKQVEALCRDFKIQYDDDENYHVLTLDNRPASSVITSQFQLLDLPHTRPVVLWRASSLVGQRLEAVKNAEKSSSSDALRALFAAFHGESNVADEVVEQEGIPLVIKASLTLGSTELAMECLCELLQCGKATSWIEEQQRISPHESRDLTAVFFQRLFLELFRSLSKGSEYVQCGDGPPSPPRSCLYICLFFLHLVPSCAAAAHAAAMG